MGRSISEILTRMQDSPTNVRFADLKKVCDNYFDRRGSATGSHVTYKTPWVGDPRVNIQNNNGKAKPYQVRQVLSAVNKIQTIRPEKED